MIMDTGEEMGVWLRPAQVTETGHQEAWQLGRRQDFNHAQSLKTPIQAVIQVSLESVSREEETPFQGFERSISSNYEH